MKALPLSDLIHTIETGSSVCLVTSGGLREIKKIKSIRKSNKYLIISFHDIADRDTAFRYRNSTVNLNEPSAPVLKQGEYLCDQLIGLSVVTTDGEIIGRVEEIFGTGSNDVYVVRSEGSEHLIPAIKDVIKEIDLEGGKIVIQVMKGLLD